MKKFTRVQLEANNEQEYQEQVKAKRDGDVYSGLLRLLSQVCDEAATGSNTWVSLGKTQDGSALALTVHSPDGKLSCYASTFGGIAMEAKDLL